MKQLFKTGVFFMFALALSFTTQSCTSTKMIEKSKLNGHWILETLNGNEVKGQFKGGKPTLEFDFEKNAIHGSASCNSYSGGFTLDDKNQFSAPNLATTMMACMNMELEPVFLEALSKPNLIVSLNETGILSFTEGNKPVLTFKQGQKQNLGSVKVTAETLAGDWKLVKLNQEDLSKLFGEKMPTANISAEGKMSGFAGCNRFNTTYALDGDQIKFTPPISTRMACPSLEGESKFLEAFSEPLNASIVGGNLTFTKGGVIVAMFEKTEAAD